MSLSSLVNKVLVDLTWLREWEIEGPFLDD